GVEERRGGVVHCGGSPVPEFHVELDRLFERNRVECPIAAVDGITSFEVSASIGLGMEGGRELLGTAPGVAVVILSSGAEMRREVLAIDIDLLIPFAPPSRRAIEQREGVSHIDSFPFDRDV